MAPFTLLSDIFASYFARLCNNGQRHFQNPLVAKNCAINIDTKEASGRTAVMSSGLLQVGEQSVDEEVEHSVMLQQQPNVHQSNTNGANVLDPLDESLLREVRNVPVSLCFVLHLGLP